MPLFAAALATLLATAPAEESASGFHVALGLGAGYSYDGFGGLRLEGRYGPLALSVGLGRDALGSTETTNANGNTTESSALHSLSGSVRYISGGSRGLVLALTLWGMHERSTGPFIPSGQPDDKYRVLEPAVGWRFREGPGWLELMVGWPYNTRRTSRLIDEPDVHRTVESFWGFTGCAWCDVLPLPSLTVGLGLSY